MTFPKHLRVFVQKFLIPLAPFLMKHSLTWLLKKPFLATHRNYIWGPWAGVFPFNGFSIWTMCTMETNMMSHQAPTREVPVAPAACCCGLPAYPGAHSLLNLAPFCSPSLIPALFALGSLGSSGFPPHTLHILYSIPWFLFPPFLSLPIPKSGIESLPHSSQLLHSCPFLLEPLRGCSQPPIHLCT